MDLSKLKDRFPESDLEWRVQRSGIKNKTPWALVVPYITNRAIMDRLDEVCGPENWSNGFLNAPGGDGGVVCGISIKAGDEWVTKYDGAERTNIEAVKGGLSNAMKRAAVQWGIGRYLYELDGPFFAVFSAKGKNSDKIENTFYRWDPPKLTDKVTAPPDNNTVEHSPADIIYDENRKFIDDKKLDGTLSDAGYATAIAWLDTYARTVHGQDLARTKLAERFAPKDDAGVDEAFGTPELPL